jgi:flagellin
MSVINTNISATIATNAMARNERQMSTAMERLSTGLRINSAKDDAAGLAISSRMKAVVSGLTMASKNANDAISMLEVAEGATLEISNMLIRMRELAVQSASGTYSDSDRDALDLEFGALMSEMDRIAKNTTWNTMSILNGGNDKGDASVTKSVLDIQLGANASQKMELSLKAWVPSVAVDMQATTASGTGSNGLDPLQTSTVTLKPLFTGDTLTIGGKEFVAAEDLTAAQAAEKFVASLQGDGNGIVGWRAEVDADNTSAIRFISTAQESIADLTVESEISASPSLVVTTQGADAIVDPATDAIAEVATLTFKPLAKGDEVIVDGVTLIAESDLTAEAAAQAFHTAWSEADSGASGDYTAARDGKVITFTAADAGDIDDLMVGGDTVDQALSAAVTEDFRKNESAFGDAILYWNDNGTAKAINIDTVGNSEFAIDQLDKAILGIATERAKYGAYMSRLEHSSDNLLNVAQNTDQSRSRIEDADYAVETSELARTQIISQAATAMLAQANQAKQGVLQLLQ